MRSLQGISGVPGKRDFAEFNLHLPVCRSLGAGRALFEQTGKDDLFSRFPKKRRMIANSSNIPFE
jgi:hypothetical protein